MSDDMSPDQTGNESFQEDWNNFKVGPELEFCLECGGTNGDGYESSITHNKGCKKILVSQERERKYLLDPKVVNVLQGKYEVSYHLLQHYFVTGEHEVRIRSKGNGYVMTCKIDTTNSEIRGEVEFPITVEVAEDLILVCKDYISKRRVESQRWFIDIFYGERLKGLALAEYELSDADTAVPEPPEWLKPFIIRDVTDDTRYRNGHLATCEQIPK